MLRLHEGPVSIPTLPFSSRFLKTLIYSSDERVMIRVGTTFLILIIIVSLPVFASSLKIDQYLRQAGAANAVTRKYWPNGNLAMIATDTNGDGTPDVFDYYNEQGQIVKRTHDRNFDGKIDEITIFSYGAEPKITIERDNEFKDHFDQKEQWERKGAYFVVSRSIREGSRNPFTLQEINRVEAEQFQTTNEEGCNCKVQNSSSFDQFKELSTIFLGVGTLGSLENDFYSTNYGFKIQKKCVDTLGASTIDSVVQNMLAQGILCQWALGTSQARLNVHKITSLLYNTANPIKLSCGDGEPLDSGELGHATALPTEKGYPSITVNLDEILKHENMQGDLTFLRKMTHPLATGKVIDQITNTLFHELMHLTGHVHEVDVEYPYTCEACCFTAAGIQAKVLGCKICRGTYQSATDPKYVNDATDFFQKDKHNSLADGVIANYLKKFPQDRWARFKLVDSMSQPESGLAGAALASALEREYKDLSPEEKRLLVRAQDISKDPYRAYLPIYKNATASYVAFLDGDYLGSEQALLKVSSPNDAPDAIKRGIKRSIENRAWALYDHYKLLSETDTVPDQQLRDEQSQERIFSEFLNK